MRYKIVIEYDGTNYYGWQKQEQKNSIQENIETALTRFTQRRIRIYGASRTDAGVHAFGQVAHFDLDTRHQCKIITAALNFYLKGMHISIISTEETTSDFHARFNATEKTYKYRILNRPTFSPLRANRVWHIPQELNQDKMLQVCEIMQGQHDWSSFKKKHCQNKSAIKTITKLDIVNKKDEIHITIVGRSFLYNQVRIITALLVQVGLNKKSVEDLKCQLIHPKQQNQIQQIAPACGLYLVQIKYSPTTKK